MLTSVSLFSIGDPSRPVVGKQNTLFVLPAEVRQIIYGHALSTGSADVEDPEMNDRAVVVDVMMTVTKIKSYLHTLSGAVAMRDSKILVSRTHRSQWNASMNKMDKVTQRFPITTLIYAIGADIIAAAGTRRTLQLFLVKGFESKTWHDTAPERI
ncbi:hypothetical protein D6D15_09210 [Aureobasidium pullulans]|uniref:Uncharacterized protein n=1 Tax=Aureobasidium pullulans TaxID=5580 RepID=A0A4V4IU37_AURPU|nr:hypothetical protein D6D15_09210 [Aureobasidium pullulans]